MRAATDTMMAAGVAAGRAVLPHADGQIGYAQVRAIWQAMTTIEALEAGRTEARPTEGWIVWDAHHDAAPPVEGVVIAKLTNGTEYGPMDAASMNWGLAVPYERMIVAYKVVA